MSDQFEKVKYYFEHKHWTLNMVRNAVGKWITEEEYTEITGLKY